MADSEILNCKPIDLAETLEIPWPRTRPFGSSVRVEGIQEVWEEFIKPIQDRDTPPSIEERMLMAIIRSVYDGMHGITK